MSNFWEFTLYRNLCNWLKNNYSLVLIFLGAFIFRLYLNTLGYHIDMLSIAPWGEWIFDNGTKGFYEAEGWIYSGPTQPPLAQLFYGFIRWDYFQTLELFRYLSYHVVPYLAGGHMLWWFNFVVWFDVAKYPVSDISLGYLLMIKLAAILADLAIAWIIYLLASRKNLSGRLILPFIYLASPFSWYISALWGQYDQVGFLVLLVSFLLLYKKYLVFAPLMLLAAIELKPTSLVFIPIFGWIYILSKPKMYQMILGVMLCLAVFTMSIVPFTDNNPLIYAKDRLYPLIFQKSEFRISTHAYNFWHIIIGNTQLNQNTNIAFLPARIWSYLLLGMVNLYAIVSFKRNNPEKLFKALFVVGMGSWMFMMNMSERYLFAGVVLGLICTIYRPRNLMLWGLLSLSFWINLFDGWWFPAWCEPLKLVLQWQNGAITRLLSLVNLLIFINLLKPFEKFNVSIRSLIKLVKIYKQLTSTVSHSSHIRRK